MTTSRLFIASFLALACTIATGAQAPPAPTFDLLIKNGRIFAHRHPAFPGRRCP